LLPLDLQADVLNATKKRDMTGLAPVQKVSGDHPPFRQRVDYLRRGASSAPPARCPRGVVEIGEPCVGADRIVKVKPANCRC
jgi:hypothetical protein